MTISQRLREVRTKLGMNQEVFGNELNTNQAGITDIERGKKMPSIEVMEIIHNKFRVDLNWFVVGTGSMKTKYGKSDIRVVQEEEIKYNDSEKLEMQKRLELQEKYIALLETSLKECQSKKSGSLRKTTQGK